MTSLLAAINATMILTGIIAFALWHRPWLRAVVVISGVGLLALKVAVFGHAAGWPL